MTNAVYCAMGEEHALMAVRSAQTFRRHMPSGRTVVYVDQKYRIPIEQIVRPEYFEQPFMVANVMCQFDWMARCRQPNVTYFLDNDILMMQEPPELPDADLCVTWRDDVGELSLTQPYNYGVLITRHTMDTVRAFAWLEDRVRKLTPQRQKWYGNQIALRELAGPIRRDETVLRDFGYFKANIHQLPCDTWNWSPPPEELEQDRSDKVFVHLKGDRKSAFDYYHERALHEETDQRRADQIPAEAGS